MNLNLIINTLAVVDRPSGDIGYWATVIIVIAALVGIMLVALRYFGITIPREIWIIIGIVAVAFVAIVAVKFLLSMA